MKAKPENLLKGKKDNSRRKGWPAQEEARRREEAKKRQEIHNSLTTEQKLTKIYERMGVEEPVEEFTSREVARLRAQLKQEQERAAHPKKEKVKA